MSILINMEMPKNCLSCPLQSGTADCRLTQKTYNWGLSEHPSDCPLVPVPPHGRWNNIIQGIVPSGQCSNCGAWDKVTRFCPNCGADMRESPKEET